MNRQCLDLMREYHLLGIWGIGRLWRNVSKIDEQGGVQNMRRTEIHRPNPSACADIQHILRIASERRKE